jgi:hypothetical protein
MRGIESTRCYFALLALLAGGLLHAAGVDVATQASRDSAFIQRLLHQTVGADHRSTRIATFVLYRTGNIEDGKALEKFDARRLLAKFLGQPFEFSGTIGQAIEAEHAAEPLEVAVHRALAAVRIDFASPAGTAPELTSGSIQLPMTISHTLRVPLTQVGMQIGKTQLGKPQPYYLFLTCKPAAGPIFAPGPPQRALCSGHEERAGTELALQALTNHDLPSPLPAYSFFTHEADAFDRFLRFNEQEDRALVDVAAGKVRSASCEDLGNCQAVGKMRAAQRWHASRRPVLAALAVIVLLLAVFAASRVPSRKSSGWFFDTLSILVIAVSALAIAIIFPVTAPDLGLEGFIYIGFYIYGLLPHLAMVSIVAASLGGGGATRLRAFAVTLGALTPLLVLLCIALYAK